MKTLWSAGIALLAIAVCVPTVGAETTKCQRAIAKANSQFLQARVKALDKCNQGVVKGSIVSCPDSKASASIGKAESKLASAIGKSCGGNDKVCGGNLTNEDSPVSLGWPNVCPNFEKGDCTNAIDDCGDIATCLACVGAGASDQAMGLYYGDLALPSNSDKALNKCQISIGKASSAFLNAQSKALQKCWDARLNGKHTNDCFAPHAGDGKYAAAILKAQNKQAATICKACGGADKACGGGDDITAAAIGFVSDCSMVTRPFGGAACSGPIADLSDIVACTQCVTQYKAECADVASVPQFEAYPAECNACTQPAPTGACPSVISFTADGPNVELDTGFTGLAHDAQVPTNGRITLAVTNCDSVNHPGCGECDVNGPLPNDGGIAFNNRRCQDASWVTCSADADCTAAQQCVGGTNNGALCTSNPECPGNNCNGGANNGAACTVASECPGGSCDAATCANAGYAGPCIYYFGAPLPLRAGGVSTCVVNEILSAVGGTINIDDGTSTTNVPLTSKVYPVGTEFAPCPRCEGGTCQSGPRLGQVCDVNGTGQFGDVSLDCPPNPGSLAGSLGINLNIATGVQTRTLSAANPNCRQTGYTGLKCQCDSCNSLGQEGCATNADCPANGGGPGICGGRRCIGGSEAGQPCRTCIGGANHGSVCADSSACPGGACLNPRICNGGTNDGAACNNNTACPGGGVCGECAGGGQCNQPGEATQPNSCNDDTSTVAVEGCEALAGDPDNGECSQGPFDQVCSIQTFRSCSIDTDCAPPPAGSCNECLSGQTCTVRKRPCFTDNGIIGASIEVQGNPDTPCGGVSKPTVGTFFCVAPVGATAVNAAGGLPGLGRVRIPGLVLIDP